MIRATFTVKGGNVAALQAEADKMLAELGGDTHEGSIDRFNVEVDSSLERQGDVTSRVITWRADIEAHLYPKSDPNDVEPF